MLGVAAAMMGAGAVILRFSDIDHVLLYVVFGVMALAFLGNAITDALIFRLNAWRTSPGMAKLAPNLGVHKEGEFAKSVGDAFGQAVECNDQVLKEKAQILQWSIRCLYIEVVALVVLAALSLWLSGQEVSPVSQLSGVICGVICGVGCVVGFGVGVGAGVDRSVSGFSDAVLYNKGYVASMLSSYPASCQVYCGSHPYSMTARPPLGILLFSKQTTNRSRKRRPVLNCCILCRPPGLRNHDYRHLDTAEPSGIP